jgi:hypothetical protein
MGIAFRSTSLPLSDEVRAIAETINSRLRFFGGWYFQLRADAEGRFKLLEVSCRQAGTMALYRHKGVNFALLGVMEAMGIDTDFVVNPGQIVLDRSLRALYRPGFTYDHVYVDFDDTVLVRGAVNVRMMAFLYQCRNNGVRLTLLTRHAESIAGTLAGLRISEGLFDAIVHLGWEDRKSDHIEAAGAIFIDNSFAERRLVAEELGIPVFDLDAVDALLEG